MSLQAELDQLTYPPTHTYTLEPLEATGVLAERFGNLQRIAPTFFEGESLLDIGASKGFYSLWAGTHGFKTVVTIEPQEEYANLLRRILSKYGLPSSVVRQEKFGAFCEAHKPLLPRYDRILITNAHHYLFGEYGGYGWWQDVADLCRDGAQVVVEGPTDMRDPDCFVPKLAPEIEAQYNTGSFLSAPMRVGFELRGAVDSPRSDSDRCMMLFVRRGRKHSSGGDRVVQKETLQISRLWRETKTRLVHRMYQSTCGLFCKEEDELRLDPEYHLGRLRAVAKSPFATPIEAFIYDGDELAGWAEPDMLDAVHWYKPNGPNPVSREEFWTVLQAHCLYQMGLVGDGYLDMDNGAGNWGCDVFGRQYVCDKGAVHSLDIASRGFQVPNDYSMKDPEAFRDGSYFRLAHREYSEWLTRHHEQAISQAVQERDAPAIERAFLNLYQATKEGKSK